MAYQDVQVHLIEGFHQNPLPSHPDIMEGMKQGTLILMNAARPFPAHESYTGEFMRGVFYGVIYPDQEYADQYQARAIELDAHQLAFHTMDEVLEYCQQYYDEKYPGRVNVHEHDPKDVIRSFLNLVRTAEEEL